MEVDFCEENRKSDDFFVDSLPPPLRKQYGAGFAVLTLLIYGVSPHVCSLAVNRESW